MLKPLLAIALLAASFGVTPALAAPKPKPPLTAEQLYERMCANVLNTLPRVRTDAVAAVPNDALVSIHRICTGVDLNSFGNTAGLGRYIAQNPALRRALARSGYSVDEVVGIAIAGGSVQLYVHRA